MFNHIAAGSDGSTESSDAVALGAMIASATGGRLSLVGVFAPAFLPIEAVSDRKTLRADATRTLRRQRDQLAPDASIHTVADMSVARALRHFARRRHADLIVVGSSRLAASGHVRIGRSGRQLVYDAPFALAVAARGLHQDKPRLNVLGAGYDAGAEAQAALAVAANLAGAVQGKLIVRRVVEDRVPVLSGKAWLALADWSHADMWADARRMALAETEDAVAQLAVPTEVSATVGDPGYEMRAFSSALDLVVVGSRRWGPVARLVTGGVGETLVADAGCSVLIVARPASAGRRRPAVGRARTPALA